MGASKAAQAGCLVSIPESGSHAGVLSRGGQAETTVSGH